MGETLTKRQWILALLALGAIIFCVGALAYLFHVPNKIQTNNAVTRTPTQTMTVSPTVSMAVTNTAVPLGVSSVDLTVNPATIAGMTCGTNITFTYTVTFHVVPNSAGGTIQFMWTTNNGRSSTDAHIFVAANETSKVYTFQSTGLMASDHTFPGIAEVIVNSPNTIHSQQIQPSGFCY